MTAAQVVTLIPSAVAVSLVVNSGWVAIPWRTNCLSESPTAVCSILIRPARSTSEFEPSRSVMASSIFPFAFAVGHAFDQSHRTRTAIPAVRHRGTRPPAPRSRE
jgi:hypothetical protein